LHLRDIQRLVHKHYTEKGFEARFNAIPDKVFADVAELGLVCSEIAGEAMNKVRKGKEVSEECADAVIRIANFCNRKGIDLEAAVLKKNAVNMKRPYLHGDVGGGNAA